jgi:VWFA-related protein
VSLAALALLLAAVAPPRFGNQADMIRVDVSVSRDGQPLADLTAADFEVRDQGVRQVVQMTSRSEQTVHAVLILDLSESLGPEQQASLRRSALDMLARLDPQDRASLMVFAHDVRLVCGPAPPSEVSAAIDRAYAFGSTAVYDALFAGIALSAAVPQARPVVVLFTDTIERVSWLSPWAVLEAARRSEATVYLATPVRVWGGDALPKLIGDTGGFVIGARPGRELDDAFARVLSDVKNRYLLFYEAPGGKPGWHELKVRLKNRKGKVRARRGYYVAPP